jgi:hypothetical protein
MNVIEKATEYVKSQKDDKYTPSWLDVRESYIQGHKAAYIESVHKQHFRTSEYMPPTEPGKTHNTVWVLSAGELVYYDYNEEMWYNEHGMPTHVEIWTWPEAVPVEDELEEDEPEEEHVDFEIDDRITDLVTKMHQLETVFEEMLTQHIVIKELRDFYRNRAGINTEE